MSNSIDYGKACIYEIVCKDVNVTQRYIGSTTNLTARRRRHKSACNNENGKAYNYYVYQFIRENGGFTNWSVVLVEALPDCKDEKSLSKSERKWIDKTQSELNTYIPSRTEKENRTIHNERQKRYIENNPDKIKERRQQYNENNKDKVNETNRKYREDNRDKLKEKQKRYTENNPDKIKEIKKKYREKKKQEKILGVLCVFLAGRAFLAGARVFGGNIDFPLFQNRG